MVHLASMGLTKLFNGVTALNDVSFDVKGSVIAVVGPNGSGKTTLLSIISGLRRPSSGRLYVEGFEPYRERGRALRLLSFHFSKPRFHLGATVEGLLARVKGLCVDERRFEEALRGFGIHGFASRRLYELSSGEAQIVSLAISLACYEDSIAVVDEPLTHLDVTRQGLAAEMISSRGRVVFTTHVLEEAETLADHLIVLVEGRLRWAGSLESLFSSEMHEVIVARRLQGELRRILEEEGGSVVADFGTSLLVSNLSWKTMEKIYGEGIIIGFRRAGARRKIYCGSRASEQDG